MSVWGVRGTGLLSRRVLALGAASVQESRARFAGSLLPGPAEVAEMWAHRRTCGDYGKPQEWSAACRGRSHWMKCRGLGRPKVELRALVSWRVSLRFSCWLRSSLVELRRR